MSNEAGARQLSADIITLQHSELQTDNTQTARLPSAPHVHCRTHNAQTIVLFGDRECPEEKTSIFRMQIL